MMSMFRKREFQLSNLACSDGICSFEIEHGSDSSKVANVLEARSGKMCDVVGETKVLVKKIRPKLRTGEFRVTVWNMWVDAVSRLKKIDGGFGIFLSCSRRPINMNSVLERFRHRRFDATQEEVCLTTFIR